MKFFYKIIPLLVLAVVALAGCEPLPKDKVVASVGESVLMLSEVTPVVADLAGADSLKVAQKFVDQWVRKQVKLQAAEHELASSMGEIDRLVDEYRTSLLGARLEQHYLQGRMDTLITDSMVKAYFEAHRSDFVMDRTILKGRIVRLPDTYRQSVKLFNLMGSKSSEKQQDFLDLCVKNNFELHTFDTWVDFGEFLSYLPVRKGKNYDYVLSGGEIRQMADADSKYFIQIYDVIKQGSNAPYERVADMVRRILFNRRRAQLLTTFNDSLYMSALSEGRVTINNFD